MYARSSRWCGVTIRGCLADSEAHGWSRAGCECRLPHMRSRGVRERLEFTTIGKRGGGCCRPCDRLVVCMSCEAGRFAAFSWRRAFASACAVSWASYIVSVCAGFHSSFGRGVSHGSHDAWFDGRDGSRPTFAILHLHRRGVHYTPSSPIFAAGPPRMRGASHVWTGPSHHAAQEPSQPTTDLFVPPASAKLSRRCSFSAASAASAASAIFITSPPRCSASS